MGSLIQFDFLAQLSPKFITKCIHDIISLKTPIFEKSSFETDPVGVKVIVKANNPQDIIASKHTISIDIPLEVLVTKQLDTYVGRFDKEIPFGILISHSFGIELTEKWKISIVDHSTTFRWTRKPSTSIMYLSFDLTSYVEPILRKFCEIDMPEKLYPRLQKAFEENIDHYVKRISTSFDREAKLKDQLITTRLDCVRLEKRLIGEDGLCFYGEIVVELEVNQALKKQGGFRLEIKDLKHLRTTLSGSQGFEFLSLGSLADLNPLTLKIKCHFPMIEILGKLFPIGYNLFSTVQGLATLTAYVKSPIAIRNTDTECNQPSLMLEIPLFLKVIKLGVVRTCEIKVHFIMEFVFSEMGIQMKSCIGSFMWVEKPPDFKAFGVTVVNVERELDDSLTIRIKDIQKQLWKTIQNSLEIFENNSSLMFPQFIEDNHKFQEIRIGDGKIDIIVNRKNSRHISMSIFEEKQDTKSVHHIFLVYQAPLSTHTTNEKEENVNIDVKQWKHSLDGMNQSHFL